MSARVFISHRPGDGGGAAAALAEELDAMFGDGQVVRIEADAASEERWREALAGTLGGTPILIALVTPEPPAGTGTTDDEALRARLDAGMAAGALILPLLDDGVADLAPDADLPAPFERLSSLPRQPLRTAERPGDIARLAERLRGLGVPPLVSTQPGTMPLPMPDEGPTTVPMPLEEGGPGGEAVADGGRRGVLGAVAAALLLAGGWGVWRWQRRRAANLSGTWQGWIGRRGAPTLGDAGPMLVTLAHKERSVGLSSTVAIATDPQWEDVREAWMRRTGLELKEVIYRGKGEVIDEPGPAASPASAPSAGGSAATAKAEPVRRVDPAPGLRRVVITVHIVTPGAGGERIDEGLFRGVVDPGDRRIHGRLWLESEQAERVVELRRRD